MNLDDPRVELGLLAIAIAAYWIYGWLHTLGRQLVGKVPARAGHAGKSAMRRRIWVLRRIVAADIPEVQLRLAHSRFITLSADEARRLADELEEAAKLAADGS